MLINMSKKRNIPKCFLLLIVFTFHILSFFITSFKLNAGDLTLYGRVFPSQIGVLPESVYLHDIQTGSRDAGEVLQEQNFLWVAGIGYFTGVHNDNDSVLITITNILRDTVAQTYDKGLTNAVRSLPTLYVNGHGLNIRNAFCAKYESLYTSCNIVGTDSTIFGKFLSDSAGGPAQKFNIYFNGALLPYNLNDNFKIKMRCRDSSATSIGKIERRWIDADTAPNVTLSYNPQQANISMTPRTWPDTVDVGQILHRRDTLENRTDLEKKTVNVRSDINGTNIENKSYTLEPWHFPKSCTTAVFSSWTPQRADTGRAIVNYTITSPTPTTTKSETTFVRARDVGATQILAPIGTIDSSGLVIPRARVKNYGNITQTFNVTFKIGDIYTSNLKTKTLQGGIEDTVNFNSWVPVRGIYTTKCSTYLAGDNNPSNDTMSRSLTVNINDIGVLDILAPRGTLYLRDSVQPKVKIKNLGTTTKQCSTFVSIWEGKNSFLDTLLTELIIGKESTLVFKYFKPNVATNPYWIEARISPRDNNPSNDVQEGSFEVVSPPAPPETGWVRKADIPSSDSTKAVYDGSALVRVGSSFYALRGNKSKQFYKYTPIDGQLGQWDTLESIPFRIKGISPDKKYPAAGAALAYDGSDGIYAIKAGGTREMWLYSILGDSWHYLNGGTETVPPRKGIKGGSALIFNPYDNKLYLLAGGLSKPESANFFSYTWWTHSWQTLTQAPVKDTFNSRDPTKKIAWKDGSALSLCLMDDMIYALRGGTKYGYFYQYDPEFNLWTYLDTIPQLDTVVKKTSPFWTTVKKSPKAGASMVYAYLSGYFYLIKGGGSTALWTYRPYGGGFATRKADTIPTWAKKAPANGAALTYLAGNLYLLKGNKTRQFWMYIPISSSPNKINPSIVTSAVGQGFSLANLKVCPTLSVVPNPFTKLTTIQYTVPVSRKVLLKLYNAMGRLVQSIQDGYLTAGTYATNLTTNNLAKGIYFLRYNDTHNQKEVKLIVE